MLKSENTPFLSHFSINNFLGSKFLQTFDFELIKDYMKVIRLLTFCTFSKHEARRARNSSEERENTFFLLISCPLNKFGKPPKSWYYEVVKNTTP
jgi:hypothetical protein